MWFIASRLRIHFNELLRIRCRHIAREIAITRRYYAINSRVLEKHELPPRAMLIVCFINHKKRLSLVLIRFLKKFVQSRYVCVKRKEKVGAAAFADNPRAEHYDFTNRKKKRMRKSERKKERTGEVDRENGRRAKSERAKGRWNGTLN